MTALQAAYKEFLLACYADGLKPSTIAWYRSILGTFVAHFSTCELEALTARDIRRYMADLRQRTERYTDASQRPAASGGLTDNTIAGHSQCLRRFWSWADGEYHLAANPMAGIRRARRPQPKPKTLSASDFVRLFNATAGSNGPRDRALLAFMADTGARLGGISSLTMPRLDMLHHQAIVTEKGGKARAVPFTGTTAQLLYQWLQFRPVEGDTVFGLTSDGIRQVIRRLKARAGVTGAVNPHAFRHNFARVYLQNGGDLVSLARLMGHEDIKTTADYYAIYDQSELSDMHERYSPLKSMLSDTARKSEEGVIEE